MSDINKCIYDIYKYIDIIESISFLSNTLKNTNDINKLNNIKTLYNIIINNNDNILIKEKFISNDLDSIIDRLRHYEYCKFKMSSRIVIEKILFLFIGLNIIFLIAVIYILYMRYNVKDIQ